MELFDQPFISTDEVELLLLSLIDKNELQSHRQILDLAVQTMQELHQIGGLVPTTALINYISSYRLCREDLAQAQVFLKQILKRCHTFNQLIQIYVKVQGVKECLQNNPDIYKMRFGTGASQQLVDAICQYVNSAIRLEPAQQIQLKTQLVNLLVA